VQSSFEALGTVSALKSGSNSLCLILNYQTQFKTGVKHDFVIVGPSLVEDPNGLKVADEKFILCR
jgi:hypothetical protein